MVTTELATALKDNDEIEITSTGRVTGQDISHPVWFFQEGERMFLVPVKGSDSHWYRNVVKTPSLRIRANGATLDATPSPITDASKVNDVADKFRSKYGADQAKRYFSKLNVAVEVPLS